MNMIRGTYYTGTTQVVDLETYLNSIRLRNEEIKNLREQIMELRNEHYKDKELQRMSKEILELKLDNVRGFPISKDEEEQIEKWKEKHEVEKHGLITDEQKMKAQGCCGGVYSYKFTPTSIGVIGTCKCGRCGEEFIFQDL